MIQDSRPTRELTPDQRFWNIIFVTNKNKTGAVIFDFDGVLADSEDTAYRVAARVAARKKVAPPTREFLKSHTSQEALKQLCVRWWELPYYARLSRKWAAEETPIAKLFPWTRSILNVAEKSAKEVWIVSSNSETAIASALGNSGISFPPERIRAGIGIFGKSSALKKLMKAQRLDPSRTCYVGDETRDMEAARRVGLVSVAVAWGFHTADLLRTKNPDHLVLEPSDFERVLLQILN